MKDLNKNDMCGVEEAAKLVSTGARKTEIITRTIEEGMAFLDRPGFVDRIEEAQGQEIPIDEESRSRTQNEMIEDLWGMAIEDSGSRRKKDAKGAVEKAFKRFLKSRIEFMEEDFKDIKKELVTDLAKRWSKKNEDVDSESEDQVKAANEQQEAKDGNSMRALIERISALNEAVRVDDSLYISSHGKPKGVSQWMFGFGPGARNSKDYLDDSKRNKTWYNSPPMSYAKAKKEAMRLAASLGFTQITVLP